MATYNGNVQQKYTSKDINPNATFHGTCLSQNNSPTVYQNEMKVSSSSPSEYHDPYSENHTTTLRPVHIISSRKVAPEGYTCVGQVIESPMKSGTKSVLVMNEYQRNDLSQGFNSRKANNMSSKEKVRQWMQNVPLRFLNDNVVILECYPGVPHSDSSSEKFMDFSDEQDIIDYQGRKMTEYVTTMYADDEEPIATFEEDFFDSLYNHGSRVTSQ